MTRVLITGITGMVGSHLAEYLLREHKQCEIFGLKRWRSNTVNIDAVKSQINLIDGDLMDPYGTMDLIKSVAPDYIFHLAAQSFVPYSWSNPHISLVGNVTMQLNLFEAVRLSGLAPVVQVALSSEEYGKVHPEELPIRENNPLRPLSPYAVSKVTQDMMAYQYFESYALKIIRTRAFNHEGPRRGEVFVTSSFAKQIAEIEAGLKPPVLYVGNLDAMRDWLDVRDVVRAYWMAANLCQPGDDYIIASGVSRSIRDMLNFLLSLTSRKIEVRTDPKRFRPSDVVLLRGDSSKFRKQTGWQPQISFEQMMSDLLDYWRQQLGVGIRSSQYAVFSQPRADIFYPAT
jgi:GDP-4-dehydro-6-deoxy-D-mannose reductase